MANAKSKINPTVANVHRPNLPQAKGQGNPPNDADRSYIVGPGSSTKPPRKS